MKKPELLIPAGNLEKLRTALLYGADAVYVGVNGLSLRADSSEMSIADLAAGVNEAHAKGVKVYAAANTFARNADLEQAKKIIPELAAIGIDALIISDPGMIRLIRNLAPELPLHLSTQANTTNIEAVRFWRDQGVQANYSGTGTEFERNRRNCRGCSRNGAGNFYPRRNVHGLFRTLLFIGIPQSS